MPIFVSDLLVVDGTLYASTIAHDPDGFFKGGRGVLRSTNGGKSWHNISAGLTKLEVTSLAAGPDGEWLYAGT